MIRLISLYKLDKQSSPPQSHSPKRTWETMYGVVRAAEMRKKQKANRSAPLPLTSFARHWGLTPSAQRDKDALDIWNRMTRRVTHAAQSGPRDHSITQRIAAGKKRKFAARWGKELADTLFRR